MNKSAIVKLLSDIRFWIVAFAMLRLVGITNPPLEVSHSWRQTTVAMAARNFYECDNNILYPRIDIAGDLTGITGMEFPLFNYLIYLLSLLFGYADWYGRIINLVVTSVASWYFYRLLRRFFGERHAFCSTVLLCVTLWFAYARKIMPDTFSMSLVIMGLYYGIEYLYAASRKVGSLVAYGLLMMAGVLSKLPAGYILVVLLLPFLDRAVPLCRKAWLVAVSLLCMVPVAWWYFYWTPHLVEEFGFWHFFMGKSIAEGASEIWHNMGRTLYRFYFNAMNYTGFVVFIAGLVIAFVKREKLILRVLGLTFAAFLVIMLSSGETFFKHDYYVVPFVPVMALVAGYGVSLLGNAKWRTIILVAVSLENILNHHTQFIIKESRKPVLAIERTLDEISSRSLSGDVQVTTHGDDLICINSGEDPTVMYFAHRKGWVASNEQLHDEVFMADLRQRGCRYVVVMKRVFGDPTELAYPKAFDSEDYTIYSVE